MSSQDSTARDRRMQEILAAYLQDVEAGGNPDRDQLLAQHPDLADDLRSFLVENEKMRRLSEQHNAATLAPSPLQGVCMRIRYFGDYELLEEIARGGMGVVYRARQVSLNRTVALKMILAGELASPADVQRFHAEAEAAANLDHPNIVPIYEVGEHEGQHFFSMKLIEGSGAPKPASAAGNPAQHAAARLVAKVARAVHYAHQHGILHRDLKPANLLLDGHGEPHVTDFGLAKRVAEDSGQTRTGAIVGTPGYMPPEQARGEKILSTAVDVYSLGAILFEKLTGKPPFRGETPMQTLQQVIEREPEFPVPDERKVRIDHDLETICLKCLEKDPARRYGSAEMLAEDLERWLRGEPILARPAGKAERLLKWSRRRPATAALVMTSLAAVLVLGIGAGWFTWQLKEARDHADQLAQDEEKAKKQAQVDRDEAFRQKNRADGERDRANGELMRAETLVYASKIAFARKALDEWDVVKANEQLASCKPDLRGWEHRLLTNEARRRMTPLSTGEKKERIGAVALNADGKQLACAAPDGVRLFRLPGRHLSRILPIGKKVVRLEYAPDGKSLVVAVEGELQLWDVAAGKLVRPLASAENSDREAPTFAFSGDGTRLVSSDKMSLRVWETATGKLLAQFPFKEVGQFGVSPDGGKAAIIFKSRLTIVDLASGKVLHSGPAGETGLLQNVVAWSPKGDLIAAAGEEGALFSTDAKLLRWLPWEGVTEVTHIRFSPDGRRLVYITKAFAAADLPGSIRVWDVPSKTQIAAFPLDDRWNEVTEMGVANSGLLAACFKEGQANLWDFKASQNSLQFQTALPLLPFPVLSKASGCLLTVTQPGPPKGDQSICAYDIHSGKLRHTMHLHEHSNITPCPNGRWIAAVDSAGRAQLFDFQSSKKVTTLAGGGKVDTLAFTPDGKKLVTVKDLGIQLHDLETNKMTVLCESPDRKAMGRIEYVRFSPDGRQLALFASGLRSDGPDPAQAARVGPVVYLGDTLGGPWRRGPKMKAEGGCLAFSPDGSLLAIGGRRWEDSEQGELVVLETATFRELRRLDDAARCMVANLTFSRSGDRLLVSLSNSAVRVLDTRTWQETYTIHQLRLRSGAAFFGPGGDDLALLTMSVGGRWDVEIYDAGGPSPSLPAFDQEMEAQKLFKKMEAKISSARSLHVEFDSEAFGAIGKSATTGSFDVAEGRKKYRIKSELKTVQGNLLDLLIVSDGNTSYGKQGLVVAKEVRNPNPPEVNNNHLALLARGGLLLLLNQCRQSGPGLAEFEGDINEHVVVHSFELGSREKLGGRDTQIVRFVCEIPEARTKMSVEMWIDVKTDLPVKQSIVNRERSKGSYDYLVIFRNFTVNGAMEPSIFALPK